MILMLSAGMIRWRTTVAGLAFLGFACLADATPPPGFNAADSQAWTVKLRRHSASTYYTAAHIGGYGDLELLVDTGSSHLAISDEILARLQQKTSVEPVRHLSGRMADGSRQLVPVYRLPALRLGDHCWIYDVEAAVLPGNVRPILGMNVLSRISPFMFSVDPPELHLNHCQPPLVVEAVRDPG